MANVDPFLEEKLFFDLEDYEDVLKYNKYVEFYIDLLRLMEELRKDLEKESNKYSFAIDIEAMIEENIFVIDFKNSSYTEEYLLEYYEFNKEYTEVYNHYFSFAETKGKYLQLRMNDE